MKVVVALLILLAALPCYAAATFDKEVCNAQAATNTTLDVTIDVAAGHSNLVLVALIGGGGVVNGAVTSVSGHGATWSSVGSGAGSLMDGTIYKGIAPSTGSATVTITWVGATASSSGACIYSYYNADQTTGVDSPQIRGTAGDLTVVSVSGDETVSAHFDQNSNRSVIGCTSSTDESSYTSVGFSDAHCTGAATTVFTWSGYSAISVGVAANVKQVSAGGAIIHSLSMMGIGR